ncbi:hypothetical protein Y032_0042g658 [Ancylostoma ceylanicum]|uniref:Helicase C-terminal domain-containing protein n=1 Tax=Ancylostoma ceylanicum TaxID=53326 RepID=A0A016UFB3_9BILA|nr:hypothetical protein Y032_0042g658 [Ancylostoma ceylanicum]
MFSRSLSLSEFKAGKTPIMLATDVAARGLGKSFHSQNVVEELFVVVSSTCSILQIGCHDESSINFLKSCAH